MPKGRTSAISVAALLAALAFGPTPSHAAEKFTFLTSWFAQAEHGGYYEAKAEGLYDKAGLDVEVRMGGPQVNGMQLLLAGEVDAIISYDFQVLQTVEKGLPAVAIGASFQSDLQGMMTHDDVARLDKLKDKTILIASAGRAAWWPWVKTKYGYSEEQTKPYTFNLQPFFVDPNTAQQAFPSSEPFQAMQKGVAVRFFLFADYGYPPYGGTIVTTRKTLDTRPQVLQAFLKATLEGWRDYLKNPAPGNALIREANPKMSEEQLAFAIGKFKELGVLDAKGSVPLGSMNADRWKASFDYLTSAGLLKPETDWKKAFTTDVVKSLDVRIN